MLHAVEHSYVPSAVRVLAERERRIAELEAEVSRLRSGEAP
jgi:hypothetical protein